MSLICGKTPYSKYLLPPLSLPCSLSLNTGVPGTQNSARLLLSVECSPRKDISELLSKPQPGHPQRDVGCGWGDCSLGAFPPCTSGLICSGRLCAQSFSSILARVGGWARLWQAPKSGGGCGGLGRWAPLLLPCALAQGPDTTERSAAAVRHLHFPQCKVI